MPRRREQLRDVVPIPAWGEDEARERWQRAVGAWLGAVAKEEESRQQEASDDRTGEVER